LQFFAAMIRRLAGRPDLENGADVIDDIDLGKLRALEGVREFPSRVKCATLAWHALNSALRQDAQQVSTE
jgi:nitrogen fixation NifU-like protein